METDGHFDYYVFIFWKSIHLQVIRCEEEKVDI